jgi:hypothetical protein
MTYLLDGSKITKSIHDVKYCPTSVGSSNRDVFSKGEPWTSLSPLDQVRLSDTRGNECD